MNYYNEIDPKAAAWLRELINRDLIAQGEVDERSIEDVVPSDLKGFTQCHFFAGIGGWSYALRLAGWPDDKPVWTGSCPCQPFSSAGKGAGFADERHLWPAWFHLIKQCGPPVIFGEQVASKAVDTWIDLVHADLESMGYAFGSVPFSSAGVGAPHIRDRNYWCGVGQADSDNARLEGWRISAQRPNQFTTGKNGLVGGLGDAACATGERDARSILGAQAPIDCARGIDGRVDIGFEHAGAGMGSELASPIHGFWRNADWLADADLRGRQPQPHPECTGVQPAAHGATATREQSCHDGSSVPSGPGPVNGFWGDADWLYCRDGKWRPVEPGTFPLAHGVPARVVRLRGYGNAINPFAAKAFIEAFGVT